MKFDLKELFSQNKIRDITADSRKIDNDTAFFAVKGSIHDGNNYIEEAINKGVRLVFSDSESCVKLWRNKNIGCRIVIASEDGACGDLEMLQPSDRPSFVGLPREPNSSPAMTICYTPDIKRTIAEAASILYPNLPQYIIAVTGTNGKTSVVSYARQLFSLLGQKAASIGTLGVDVLAPEIHQVFDKEEYKNLTTPDSITLRKILNKLAASGINHVALEASSHGLDQNRLYNIKINAAAFISFSQDHLDYHTTMSQYLNAKLKLFSENLIDHGVAVINNQINELEIITKYITKFNKKLLLLGKNGDINIRSITSDIAGQEVEFTLQEQDYQFNVDIIGEFQIYNMLTAALLVSACGFEFANVVKYLPKLKAPRGRLERVGDAKGHYQIFIDYAHTPDALEKALRELKKIKFDISGKLKVIFGCGGNRDHSKRKIMGMIAAQIADEVIITDDNPRMEDSAKIRADILQGAPNAIVIPDRREAIITTIPKLGKNDILLIAGKGHEEYQLVGEQKIPFSDMQIAREILKVR